MTCVVSPELHDAPNGRLPAEAAWGDRPRADPLVLLALGDPLRRGHTILQHGATETARARRRATLFFEAKRGVKR